MTTTTITEITDAMQAKDAKQTITQLRKKAAAFASMDVPDEAAALNAAADELDARLEQFETAQAREAGAAVMPELREILHQSRAREEEYINVMLALVRLQAEMPRALDRFHELRRIAVIGGQDVSALGKPPQEPIPASLDPSVREDASFAIRLRWGDPDAHAELARRRQAATPSIPTSTRSSPPSFTMRWPRSRS